jgi:hypothetical protein
MPGSPEKPDMNKGIAAQGREGVTFPVFNRLILSAISQYGEYSSRRH